MADEEKNAPSLMEELAEERRKRESLEQRVNELIAAATETERSANIRAELQKLGIVKVDLAYKAVRDDLKNVSAGEIREYLTRFAAENPELLPARIAGGSGAVGGPKSGPVSVGVDLDKIRPDMSAEERERVRQEIARVASQTLRGGW
jgi:hypothetical protein